MHIDRVVFTFFYFVLFLSSTAYSQSYNLLQKSSARNTDYVKHVSKADFFTVSESLREDLLTKKPSIFQQNIEIENKKINIVFEKNDILAPGFHIKTSDGQTIYPDRERFVTYRGQVKGAKNSWVTLSVTSDQVKYLIATDEGNYEINKSTDGLYAGYFSKHQLQQNTYESATDDIILPAINKAINGGTRIGNCLEIYIETDFFTLQSIGNVGKTDEFIRTVFQDVAAVYAMHGVTILLSQLFIHTSTDPYASMTNLATIRNQFVNNIQNNYTGRIAQFVSLRQLGGGLANGIGGFCNSYPTYPGPQCIATNLSEPRVAFPNYSFNTYVLAHEIGHVMGLRHTHACVWNNLFVQIDDCGNVVASQNGDTPEGTPCYNVNTPILPASGGTIMSQCHQVAGTGINLNLGFGTLPGQLLYENFVFAPCITGNTCAGIAPVNDLCSNAISIPVNNTCQNNTFTNQNATATNGPPAFTCGNPGTVIKDVWFKVTIPSSGNVTIATSQASGGLTDVLIQAYGGNCGSLTTIACDDNNGPGNHALLNITGRTPGEVIYIRLVDTQSNQEGTFNICAHDVSVPCHPDFATLVAFYNATGGPSWTTKTGWQNGASGTDCNVCNWYGVQCNELNRVSVISLSSNNVTTSSLPTSLANLTYLSELRLYNNNLSGTFPTFLGSFAFLNTIDFGNNNISGNIPTYLGNISTLKNLYLDGNALTGPLPATLTNIGLSLIYVNNNNLSGCFPAGYSIFCNKAYNFSANPNLAGGISFATYCINGNGGDEDSDGFCKALGDCDDSDATVYPGATEVCDLKDNDCNGLIDDVAAPLTNTWIAGNGDWGVPSNWSLGIVPQRCHNVVIAGTNGIQVTINTNTSVARSVTVQSGKNLVIASAGVLTINHGLNIINQGNIINNGNIIVNNILSTSTFGINNTGTITNQSTGTILIQNSGDRSFSNNAGGILTNNGSITIDRHVNNNTSTGLYNFGSVTNNASITVRNIVGNEVRLAPGASFTNQMSGILVLE